jgi:hypothetical protein
LAILTCGSYDVNQFLIVLIVAEHSMRPETATPIQNSKLQIPNLPDHRANPKCKIANPK